MPHKNIQNQKNSLKAQERICAKCGKHFIIRRRSGTNTSRCSLPVTCGGCRKTKQIQRQKEQEERENQQRKLKKEQEHQEYLAQLPGWNVVSRDSIQPRADQVLYILGNGFDLMHRVPSSYYAFRDSLGKNNELRCALENFWMPDDLWADFESALAQFNAEAMSSSFMMDTWLDTYEGYRKDAGAAEFFMAVEGAANPMLTVVRELPRRFRKWVESLRIGTDARPLRSMFRNGKVLCFNYTEFVETMYGVSEDHVCYIHGCRRKKKSCPKDELILGHLPGASESAFDYEDKKPQWLKQRKKRDLITAAQAEALHLISECDDRLTKHASQIIAQHNGFFDSLDDIKDIIVIGHSLSPVDWDYFHAVCSGLQDKQAARWYFGCHGLRDLKQIEQLITKLEIPRASVSVFRTDDISVTPLTISDNTPAAQKPQVKVYQKASDDERWIVQIAGSSMAIRECYEGDVVYETLLPAAISGAFFSPSGEHLFVIIRGIESGVLLFRHVSNCWQFVDELEGIPNQGIINRRLCHVFLKAQEITFVYNSRIRVYDLCDGRLIRNQAQRDARNGLFDGVEIGGYFITP